MKDYSPIGWKMKVLTAAATLALAITILELVVGSMKFPDPETMAARQRVIAAQGERALQIRELQRGEVRIAEREVDGGAP